MILEYNHGCSIGGAFVERNPSFPWKARNFEAVLNRCQVNPTVDASTRIDRGCVSLTSSRTRSTATGLGLVANLTRVPQRGPWHIQMHKICIWGWKQLGLSRPPESDESSESSSAQRAEDNLEDAIYLEHKRFSTDFLACVVSRGPFIHRLISFSASEGERYDWGTL